MRDPIERTDRELASFERPSASDGERRAADWIAGELRSAGCRDVRVEEERAQHPSSGQAPERQQQRPQEDAKDDRDALVGPLMELRHPLHRHSRKGRVEDEAGVGGVVVGDEHDRPGRVGIAELGDHVPGGPVRKRAAPKPELAP